MNTEQAVALRKPFPPESVGRLPKGGVMLDYVGHAAVTDRLLTVDPDWSWEPFALGADGLPALDRSGNLWIRLTICGVTRIGVGDGKSAKESIGDAIRNAAMRFGVALDLWSKDDLVEFAHAAATHRAPQSLADVIPPAEPTTEAAVTPAQIRKLGVLMHGKSRDDALADVARIIGRPVASRNDLTKAEAGRVIDALESPADTDGAPA